jgi:aminopeptidase N
MLRVPVLAIVVCAGVIETPAFADDECCGRLARAAREAKAFDPETGRDLLHYPPHRYVDHQHMKLVIDIPDMNTPRAHAEQTLTVTSLGKPVAMLTLDARLLEIESVISPGRTVSHEHDGRTLTVRFDPPLAPGAPADIVTKYTINDPPQGLVWTPESSAWPDRRAQLHSQGEAEENSYWFPCHDFPNERLTTELVVSVPPGFMVSSNGRLADVDKSGARQGRDTYHWVQDKPHVNYLVSLVVGKFDTVDLATLPPRKGAPSPSQRVPMPVHVPPGRGKDIARTYARTPEMIGVFERLTGEPYPWDRYAQVVVWNFGPGGMENTSATTMYDTAVLSERGLRDGDLDGLISHELAHQWFGDLITCNSWEHIWLNEGFATYFTQLWFEHRDGPDAYLAGVLGNFDACRTGDKPEAPEVPAMLRKAYARPDETFRGPHSPYPRGSAVLHMLRRRLGDDLFFRGLAAYVDRCKLKTAETSDLRRVMEEVSGESLEQFFQQWCARPGMPDLDISLEWESASGELVVSVKQTQQIDGYNPAYDFELPLVIGESAQAQRGRGGLQTVRHEMVVVRGKEATVRVPLGAEPPFVAVDPELTVLSRNSISQPVQRWIAQLDSGLGLAARVQALRAVALDGSAESAAALARAAAAASNHPTLRSEAITALRTRGDAAALLNIAPDSLQAAEVRVAWIEALAELAAKPAADARLSAALIEHAASDWSERTRAAALIGLGKLKAREHLPLLLAALDTPSQHDRLRQGALDALAAMDAPGTIGHIARFALPGTLNRTRPSAIKALAKVSAQDPEVAFKVLALVLKDRERRAWEAAGPALVEVADERALAEFEAVAATKRDPEDQEKLHGWAAELKEKLATKTASR